MQSYNSPEVTFRLFHQNKSPLWLIAKKNRLEAKWNAHGYGKKVTGRILKECNRVVFK